MLAFAKTTHENYTRTGQICLPGSYAVVKIIKINTANVKRAACLLCEVSQLFLSLLGIWVVPLQFLWLTGLFDTYFWTDEIPFMLTLGTHRWRAMWTLYCIFRVGNLNSSKYLLSFIWISYDQGVFSLKSRIKTYSRLKSWLHCPSTSLAAPPQ